MAQVKLNLRGLDIAGKIQRATLIVKGLRSSLKITGAAALADKIEGAAAELQLKNGAQLDAKKTWNLTVDEQEIAENAFDATYSSVGADVQSLTGGDEIEILGTNFEVRAAPSKAPAPGKILNLQATQGDDAGELDIHWDGLKDATSYASQITDAADPNTAKWNYGPPIQGKRSASQIKGLTSNQGYWLRVQGINATDAGPWSDPVYKAAP